LGLLAASVSAQNGEWQQCGGTNYSGVKGCNAGLTCVPINDYYHQCQQGGSPPDPEPTPTDPTDPTDPTVPSGGPGTTLRKDWLWIRAVAAPNFHKYMQSSPLLSEGTAVLGSHTTAGQFNVIDGQLVQLVTAPGTGQKVLYGNVSQEKSFDGKALAVTFSESKNTYGTFGWQGDGLTWQVAGISRPNLSAWYVCTGQAMYINLGNYLSNTPAGCADQTIHYYNDSKAND
ncbi:carbohydrate-binding module family 1 protein, partial [Patellaria atrata CBS 101060]